MVNCIGRKPIAEVSKNMEVSKLRHGWLVQQVEDIIDFFFPSDSFDLRLSGMLTPYLKLAIRLGHSGE